jgi:hypothetical protein
MSIGIFIDKDHQPTTEEVSRVHGSRQPLWARLAQFISDNYQMSGDLVYGGQKYGWNVRYRKGGKTLVNLYPQQRYFVAQIVLGKDQAQQASALNFGKRARQVFDDASQLHDGKWLFIEVRSQQEAKDIEQLLQIKKRPRQFQRSVYTCRA